MFDYRRGGEFLPNDSKQPIKPVPQKRLNPGLESTAADSKKFRSYDISSGALVPERTGDIPDIDTGAMDFNVDFDFESEYRDIPEDKPLRLRREKRTGCVGGILYAVFVICISLVLAALMWTAASDVLGFGTIDEQVSISVPRDFTVDDVSDLLYDAGLIRHRFLFRLYAGFSDAEDKIVPGSYMLNKSFDYRALVQGMTSRSGVRVETTVTIPEGLTLTEIFARLDDFGVTTSVELWEAAANHDFAYDFLDRSTLGDRFRLEGYLFPDTYNFFIGSSPVQVLTRMLSQFNRVFNEELLQRANQMGHTVHEIVTIASMIEREAGSDDERARIAAVIYNRLYNWSDPLLQIDATLGYAAVRMGRPFVIDTDIDSPYNTYRHTGLPPGPIAGPGLASITAALYPESTNEYYYALTREGTHFFSRTYEEHMAFVQSDDFGGR